MYLRHKISGECFLICKNYGTQWSVEIDEERIEKLNDFFFDHIVEDQKFYGQNYEIIYEDSAVLKLPKD